MDGSHRSTRMGYVAAGEGCIWVCCWCGWLMGEVVLKGFMFVDTGSCLSRLDQLSLVAQLQIYPRLQFL